MGRNTQFTVVIPTRERCDTLYFALKTCTEQEYENLQIIVADNFSQDNTKSVVDAFNDKRILYVNSGKRLSMSENWEFALSHLKEGYVTFLGDDDGLLPNALNELDVIIRNKGCAAISWNRAPYFWPDCDMEARRNLLVIHCDPSLNLYDSKRVVYEVINFKRRYEELPMLYNGFVQADVIGKARNKNGRFFNSITPDIYSGFAVASIIDTYIFSPRPYGLAGVSRHSNGMYLTSSNTAASEASQKYYGENTLSFHPNLVVCPSFEIVLAEAYLQCQDNIPSANSASPVDIKMCIKRAISNSDLQQKERFAVTVAAVKDIASKHGLESFAGRMIDRHRGAAAELRTPTGYYYFVKRLVLNCSDFYNVNDVYGASLLCKFVLDIDPVKYLTFSGVCRNLFTFINQGIRMVARKILKR